jgi:hypothetical protein
MLSIVYRVMAVSEVDGGRKEEGRKKEGRRECDIPSGRPKWRRKPAYVGGGNNYAVALTFRDETRRATNGSQLKRAGHSVRQRLSIQQS